jgi:hypothetical protein
MSSFKKDSSDKGDSAEVLFMGECLKRGYSVSIPFGHNNLYDLVVEGACGKLFKVQIKMSSTNAFDSIKKYEGKVDVFAFLCFGTNWVIMKASDLSEYEYNLKYFRISLTKKFDYIEKFAIFGEVKQ